MEEDDMLSRMEDYFHILHLGEKSLDLGKILSSDTSIKILEAVYNGDADVGLSASDISEVLDVGRTTVIYHLGRMQERGLVKINPILEDDEIWKKFWDLYRKKGIDVEKEQFDKLHNAKMNGVKLFVPTKKGFLVMPSTDMVLGQSMVMEALNSITEPVLESDYKKVAKSSSIFGILGLLLIALSLLVSGLPFLQFSSSAATSLSSIEDASYAAAPATMAPAMTTAPAITMHEKAAHEAAPAATSAPEMMAPSMDAVEEEEPAAPIIQVQESRTPGAARALSYAGTLLLGSVLMFLLYSYIRRK
jgi:DNA-binding transcriptional ArsR family regulator